MDKTIIEDMRTLNNKVRDVIDDIAPEHDWEALRRDAGVSAKASMTIRDAYIDAGFSSFQAFELVKIVASK